MTSIKDIAQIAGVAVGTVSRVINNSGPVKLETRRKVEEVIRRMNYVPNEVARNFKMQKSKMVALLLPSIWHPFFSELAYYIEDELDQSGFKLMLCNSGGKPEKELYYLDMLRQNKVAGIVGITYNDIEKNVGPEIPMVSIDRRFDRKITCVTSDNFEGGRIALQELVKAGVQRPVFIGAVAAMSSETMNRKAGFVHEAQRLGVDGSVFERPDPIMDEEAYFDEFFRIHPEADGVFAINDMFAAKYIDRAVKLGLKVPEDVKVIGYDGIQSHTYFHPVLSTIRQPVEAMARTAVQLLFRKMNGEGLPRETYRLPVIFRRGETT
ncbi:LacI family DNA-binding transcriptional regulator [Paenibacillus sp. alder61]|uniref:LacI family transcriptional regulator n=1 Tax=Paenibacillus faecis TaxID=862114 RepID=A0A5D0CUH2_9BACL|nr:MULTISPECIES: LacI family DNA-binding transcriptional regulator [Paenibacillus]MCA1291961.1 LacI family DNA-binding transcriptional regulator [Paenibacillus sp. alder61]TYA13542.1 LacI family transcriptional regulator [Paenibacillus faecis]